MTANHTSGKRFILRNFVKHQSPACDAFFCTTCGGFLFFLDRLCQACPDRSDLIRQLMEISPTVIIELARENSNLRNRSRTFFRFGPGLDQFPVFSKKMVAFQMAMG